MARTPQQLGAAIANIRARMALDDQRRGEQQQIQAQAVQSILGAGQAAQQAGLTIEGLREQRARQQAQIQAQQDSQRQAQQARAQQAQQAQQAKLAAEQRALAQKRQQEAFTGRTGQLARRSAAGEDVAAEVAALAGETGRNADFVRETVDAGAGKETARKTKLSQQQASANKRQFDVAKGSARGFYVQVKDLPPEQQAAKMREFAPALSEAQRVAILEEGKLAENQAEFAVEDRDQKTALREIEKEKKEIQLEMARNLPAGIQNTVSQQTVAVKKGIELTDLIKEGVQSGEYDHKKMEAARTLANKVNLPATQSVAISTQAGTPLFSVGASTSGGGFEQGQQALFELNEYVNNELNDTEKEVVRRWMMLARAKLKSEPGVATDQDWAFYKTNLIKLFDSPGAFTTSLNAALDEAGTDLQLTVEKNTGGNFGPTAESMLAATQDKETLHLSPDVLSGVGSPKRQVPLEGVPGVPSLNRAVKSGVDAAVEQGGRAVDAIGDSVVGPAKNEKSGSLLKRLFFENDFYDGGDAVEGLVSAKESVLPGRAGNILNDQRKRHLPKLVERRERARKMQAMVERARQSSNPQEAERYSAMKGRFIDEELRLDEAIKNLGGE